MPASSILPPIYESVIHNPSTLVEVVLKEPEVSCSHGKVKSIAVNAGCVITPIVIDGVHGYRVPAILYRKHVRKLPAQLLQQLVLHCLFCLEPRTGVEPALTHKTRKRGEHAIGRACDETSTSYLGKLAHRCAP